MFIKSLIISSGGSIIRNITFRKGLNLIVDETPTKVDLTKTDTGNNVGKTTVLQLIDFCLGGSAKGIYVDPDSQKEEYKLVKDFLVNNKVVITLILKEDLSLPTSKEIKIERNFLSRKDIIRRINDDDFTEDEFEDRLLKLLYPNHQSEKPTFRQIISHNIRYKDDSINSTLRTLNQFATDVEYEALYLYMFGIKYEDGSEKQQILSRLKQEASFQHRLEKKQTKSAYEAALALIEADIVELNDRKNNFNLNVNFENDLNKLSEIKYSINRKSLDISNLRIRKDLIDEAESDLNLNISKIDTNQLRAIYQQASQRIENIDKDFDDLVTYHNQMIKQKLDFIVKERPFLENEIEIKSRQLKELLDEEKTQSVLLSKSESFEELEKLLIELNEKFRKKGEYENIIQQINEVQKETKSLEETLAKIDKSQFSPSFEKKVKSQITKFNKWFASVSKTLYGESYALKHDVVVSNKKQRLYKFSAFNTNFSSGKKQGEISCFDIAYILFADKEKIPTLHFLLNDKKELMHDNQLINISRLVNKSNIQFVASILSDKLPAELNKDEYIILRLSQKSKLFKIEGN